MNSVLKSSDMSICPEQLGANSHSSALMIGEKAATIIMRELGIKLYSIAHLVTLNYQLS